MVPQIRQLGVYGVWLLLCTVSSVAAERILLDGIAAKVNDETIPVSEILIRLQPVRRELEARYAGESLRTRLEAAYQQELQALIDQKLILDAYEDQEGRVPEWAVDNRVAEVVREQFDDDREALMSALARDRLSYEEWREDLRKQLIVASMRQNRVQQRIVVSAGDILNAYRENTDRYREPLEVRLSMIVRKRSGNATTATNDPVAQAEVLRSELLEGADFGELARTMSQGPRAEAGGRWSWIESQMLRPELRTVLQDMSPGDISPVVTTEDEVYLFRLDARRGGTVQPFEAVRKEIEVELRRQEGQRLYDEWIAALRDDAYIDIVHKNPFVE